VTQQEALALFKTNGYLVIENALTADEVAFLNDFVDSPSIRTRPSAPSTATGR